MVAADPLYESLSGGGRPSRLGGHAGFAAKAGVVMAMAQSPKGDRGTRRRNWPTWWLSPLQAEPQCQPGVGVGKRMQRCTWGEYPCQTLIRSNDHRVNKLVSPLALNQKAQ